MRVQWHQGLACCAALVALVPSAWLATVPLRQWMAREAMEERILAGSSDEHLVHFAFSPDQQDRLEWERAGREFRHHGHLFDVVRSRQEMSGTLHLWCLEDEVETRLVAGMQRSTQRGGDGPEGERSPDRRTVLQLLAAPVPGHVVLSSLERVPCALCPQAAGFTGDGAPAIDPPPPRG